MNALMKTIEEKVFQKLDKIAKPFKWGRKKLKNEIKGSISDIVKKETEINKQLTERNSQLTGVNSQLSERNSQLTGENGQLTERNNQLAGENGQLTEQNNQLTGEKIRLKKKAERYDLVSRILSVESEGNESLQEFSRLFHKDFIDFANKESSLAEEAAAVLKLQDIEKELILINNFPLVYGKNILAVGGGFSSGKSAFLNQMFKDKEASLPIGIQPVTAIPAYVAMDDRNFIKGYSRNGGGIDIDKKLYSQLSHNYIKSFPFNLKKIMPFIAMGTPWGGDFKELKHICFIDTPGYNPAAIEGSTQEDRETAMEYLKRANSLIWLIGMDANGTIPDSDLDFLEDPILAQKKLYIILSKADLKPESDLKEIMKNIAEILEKEGIPYEGISAYSSAKKKEYGHRKQSLFTFLKTQNNLIRVEKKILEDIGSVMEMYIKATKENISRIKKIKSSLKSLELDILEMDADDDEKTTDRIEEIKRMFDPKTLEQSLEKAKDIHKSMEKAVKDFFDEIDNRPVL